MKSFNNTFHHQKLTSQQKKRTFSRLIAILWKDNKWWLILVAFLILLSAVGMLYQQVFIGKIVVGLFIGPALENKTEPFNWDQFYLMIFGSVVLFLVSIFSGFAATRIMINITYKTMTNMRVQLYKHMQSLPIKFFDDNAKGNLISRLTADIDTLRQFLSKTFPSIVQSLIILIASIVIMLILNWKLSLIMIGVIILIFASSFIIGKFSSRAFVKKQKGIGELTGYAEEMISGLKTVKIFNQEQNSIKQFANINNSLSKFTFKSEFWANVIWPTSQNLGNIAYAIVSIFGGIMVINTLANGQNAQAATLSGLTVGTFIAFTQFAKSFSGPVSTMTQNANSIVLALAGANRVFDIMDQKAEINDGDITLVRVEQVKDKYVEVPQAEGYGMYAWKIPFGSSYEYKILQGHIEFKNVYFKYVNDTEEYTLKDISFEALPGQKIALVGATGAGKTTITSLLARFYEISEGEILYDSIPIQKIEKDSLRKSLGYVLQECVLFSDTVKNNIAYGSDGINEFVMNDVTEAAHLNGHIEKLNDKYETILVNSGSNLSQGQRQLVSIARASYKNPPVLILDEATSNIDTHTEIIIEKAMDKLVQNRTSFIIAHRLSTIVNADKIIVLNSGEIQEMGTHDQLLQNQGMYWSLWQNASKSSEDNTTK
ncbi:ABC transporter ATP-binding protein [Mycoplasmopsis verecunda]|uniref:ATP-binding cassette, subfamily B n=1 Tax=Mycoplasmopsis verecunda TaxID=171291 RepID=A0A1T4LFL6_9BACT|nr:ABC transporter ATP-binding protein [Mycoplasmopsis verecunda]WPB54845.1 ABC transporter ATP-binding protein [Mycoplasmopsis verecunda]SJZ53460.1 ATP-binding cassette, subfamily B [Mycoplasmopsis verecunda]